MLWCNDTIKSIYLFLVFIHEERQDIFFFVFVPQTSPSESLSYGHRILWWCCSYIDDNMHVRECIEIRRKIKNRKCSRICIIGKMRYNWGMTANEKHTSMTNLAQKLVAADEVHKDSPFAFLQDIAAKVTWWKNYFKVLWILSEPTSPAIEQWMNTHNQVQNIVANDAQYKQEELKKAA